ncbi:Aste57867_18503 [Aphanomyces stellatus]|uniref:Aste57867_18503 protein n=1 Tax=Aphanomyces stellatus TaxID=120398 RepID=A0A485LAV2_9STRA|nr:hypothetical protein As57867_018441 [Aphanomyces stellatus]VFT95239.1 Aste57867_18503 [Aphanomyces stellatus]
MEIKTNPRMLDDWTSYLFSSPSKGAAASPSQVTCLEFFHDPRTNTALLLQATPGAFCIFNAHTTEQIGRKHPTDGDYVRLARFFPLSPNEKLPNVLLVTSKMSVYSLDESQFLQDIVFPATDADILDVQLNAYATAVLTHRVIRLLDRSFSITHTIATASDAMTLGTRWLAFPGVSPTSSSSDSTSTTPSSSPPEDYSLTDVAQGVASYFSKSARQGASVPGLVVVQDCVTHTPITAPFLSHTSAITALAFDPSGLLLAAASADGQTLHVHRVLDQTLLYRLHRGITPARIRHLSFSLDAKWLSATTSRGTTHLYAVRPDGGAVGGHSHALLNLNDPAQLTAWQAAAAREQQARDFGSAVPPAAVHGGALARLRYEAAAVRCQWVAARRLVVGTDAAGQTVALQPTTALADDGSLRLELAVAVITDASETTVTSPRRPSLVETMTHHRPRVPLWLHPKVSFRVGHKAASHVLSVRRPGAVPLSTPATDQHDLDDYDDEPVFVLDLAASISEAAASTVEIQPLEKSLLATSQYAGEVQDAYFDR